MGNEIPKYSPRKRVFTPAKPIDAFWNSKKFRTVLFLAGLSAINLVSGGTGCIAEINAPKTFGTESPAAPISGITVLPNTQTIPPENSPRDLSEIEFRNLFEKISRQPFNIDRKIDVDEELIRNLIQQIDQYILSKNAVATKFSGRHGKRGIQKSIIIDSADNSKSVALSAHLQGKGSFPMSADIRVVKAFMIDRDTKKAVQFLFSDLHEGERTVLLPLKQPNITNFSFWEKGEALDHYFPEIAPANMEDLSALIKILKEGKVNADLTKKSTNELDKKYNSDGANPLPPEPQPTPRYF